ncbi:LysR family transcriptional regulator [Celeribacter persicus]|jgi:Transcriptional regulator|uniref:HTH-type transcriptional regulator CbbR n=1 Tax=Celeribacter persicus TaxID=1651082 RepID=A0A2T5H552_9RHOB|nr:LysR family transcriptional regulator [Celeribacter persicus]PTQ66713.1 DNA-binding transcriptional LysR family regulator [Celeribacter persicus]
MKRLDQLTLKQLRTLQTVVHEGNISAAAEILGLTAPAVHSQLKLLEEFVGAPLLLKQGRARNIVTAQGQVLLNACDEIDATLERTLATIQALETGHSGRVVLGVVSTGKYFAPRIVALCRQAFPDIEISLRIANRRDTIAALKSGVFDLCIMGRPPREPLTDEIVLAEHPHIVIAASDHPLAHLETVPRDALLNEVFVMREQGSGTRILAARFLDEIGHGHQATTIEMDSNETIKQAVLNGLGLAMISAHTVAEELSSGRLVALPVKGLPINRRWYLLSEQGRTMSAASRKVRDWIAANTDEIFPTLPF